MPVVHREGQQELERAELPLFGPEAHRERRRQDAERVGQVGREVVGHVRLGGAADLDQAELEGQEAADAEEEHADHVGDRREEVGAQFALEDHEGCHRRLLDRDRGAAVHVVADRLRAEDGLQGRLPAVQLEELPAALVREGEDFGARVAAELVR